MTNVTEDAYNRLKKMLGSDDDERPVRPVSVEMTPVEKNVLYGDIVNMLRKKISPEEVAQEVILYLNEFLKNKSERQKGENIPRGGVFRRVE